MKELINCKNSSLITDLYELTMAAAYFENDMNFEATFDLFIRKMPPNRGFMVLGGIEAISDYLLNLHFEPEEIEYLRKVPNFKNVSPAFFDFLRALRFSGEAWMMKEGTLFFDNEPIIRITAPIIEAQIIETYLLSIINIESMVATKAARVVEAARGKPVTDFGARRAHGPEAAVRAARACYMAGCSSTSNVFAGFVHGVPISGTAAHSWTMAHEHERKAFENYLRVFPDHTVLLIDTYDTLEAAKLVKEIGKGVKGVRIDSGNLLEISRSVRKILDDSGLEDVSIIASGDLDEYQIERLLDKGAPIDAFGVGTKMVTSDDAPYVNVVYKLVEVKRNGSLIGTVKFSEDKITWPFKKQVWRSKNVDRLYDGDFISMADEDVPDSEPLLEKVIEGGKLVAKLPKLEKSREWVRYQLDRLPKPHKALTNPMRYPVHHTRRQKEALENLKRNMRVKQFAI